MVAGKAEEGTSAVADTVNRWAKAGVLDRVFAELQETDLINVKIEHVSLDSTVIKVHPDGTGALKKTVFNLSANRGADGQPKFIWWRVTHAQP